MNRSTNAKRKIAIGVGPIKTPEYLDRPQIVTQVSQNKLRISEFNRWAEPIEKNTTRVLADNLSTLLNTYAVTQYPWRHNIHVDYRVIVDITRFDCKIGKTCRLDARWSITKYAPKKQTLKRKQSNYEIPISGRDYESAVIAMSKAIEDLSREIANTIKRI